ncbi:probable glutamate receptor [Palaemon carinicauda]|uniref:probable glutamate receptor n=1 Tax=Palaemon carinicauda TaxID=392227 RepID=UPI0035B640D2
MDNLLRIISEKLNFGYELLQPPDRVWGVAGADGNWTGMLGMLQREEVEMAVGPFAVSRARETVCDFSAPVYAENMAILMVRPGIQSDLSGFLKPFTPIYNVTMQIISKSTIWVMKTLTQEASENLPTSDGCRVVIVTWLLASFVFMSSYSGILTAMLTVPRVTIPVDSIEDLVAQKDLPWRLEAGSMMYQYYQEATEGMRKKVFDGHEGLFQDCWAARSPISEGEFAGICDLTTMKKAMSWDFSTSGSCHLYISREVAYSNVMIATAYKTNSSYKARANYWIQRVKEAGLIDLWLQREITNTSQCLQPPSADRSSSAGIKLNIEAFTGPILVLVGDAETVIYKSGREHNSDSVAPQSHSIVSHSDSSRSSWRSSTAELRINSKMTNSLVEGSLPYLCLTRNSDPNGPTVKPKMAQRYARKVEFGVILRL